MKKNAFFTLICLLFALAGQAQNLATISGLVTRASNGTPVADHPIFCIAGDSINPIFVDAYTDQNGVYTATLDLPAGINEVMVTTFTFCDPASGGFATVLVNVASGAATADFQICEDSFPPFQDCFAEISFFPLDSLTFQLFGNYYSFSDSTATGSSYLWDFGDGTTSTDQNPIHTYTNGGIYNVVLTVTGDDGCVSTSVFTIFTGFNGFPECSGYIMYTQTDSLSFDFSAEIFDLNGQSIQADSYNWDFGDGNTSTDPAPSHTYAAEGVYTVQLHALTTDGCEIHACDVVFTYDGPVDTFGYGCQAMFYVGFGVDSTIWPPVDPLTFSFFDVSLGAAQSWAWDFGDGTTSTEQNPTHTYADTGVYVVTLAIETVDGCESEVSYEICVGDGCWGIPEFDCQAMFIPLGDSSGTNGIQFMDLSFSLNPIVSWTWDFGDGTTSNDQNPYHVYAQPGVYAVTLAIEGLDCNSVITFEIDTENPWNFTTTGDPAKLGQSSSSVSTKERFTFEGVKLFPNPAQTDLSIAFNSPKALEYELRISDLSGRTLSSSVQQANSGVNAARANVANLTPGLYLAEIRSGDFIRAIKFVKQ